MYSMYRNNAYKLSSWQGLLSHLPHTCHQFRVRFFFPTLNISFSRFSTFWGFGVTLYTAAFGKPSPDAGRYADKFYERLNTMHSINIYIYIFNVYVYSYVYIIYVMKDFDVCAGSGNATYADIYAAWWPTLYFGIRQWKVPGEEFCGVGREMCFASIHWLVFRGSQMHIRHVFPYEIVNLISRESCEKRERVRDPETG